MGLSIKINIKELDMLSDKNYNNILKVIEYFDEVRNINLNDANSSIFITHLCEVLNRRDRNERIARINEEAYDSIKLNEKYHDAIYILKDIKEIVGEFPIEEDNFLILDIYELLR